MGFEIPKEPIKPASKEPRTLIIYGSPKSGKTTITAQLPNSLILEHENAGADALEARYIYLLNPYQIEEFVNEHAKNPKMLDGIETLIVDTITQLDAWSEIVGTYDFMNKVQGKNFNVVNNERLAHTDPRFDTVHSLGEGYGYRYSREAMIKWYSLLISTGKRVIFIAHVKDKMIQTASGDIVETTELNLTGKLKFIFASKVDAIAIFKRKGNKGYLVFENGGDVISGSRYAYLSGKILISESDDAGNVKTYWENIFPHSLANINK
jgi:hypothetical protein